MHALAIAALVAFQSARIDEQAAPAIVGPSHRFADFDRDGLIDIYILDPTAGDRLLRNTGAGRFVDVTEHCGLAGFTRSLLALWADVDRDGWIDLYVGVRDGRSRFHRNMGDGTFADLTDVADIALDERQELFATFLDLEADGLPDLHVVTDRGDLLWRNAGEFVFERLDLAQNAVRVELVEAPGVPGALGGASVPHADATSAIATAGTGSAAAALPPSLLCAGTILDQTTSVCIEATSSPAIGKLYPLSTNLNVSSSGNVGIGTAAPGAKLDVSGSVRSSGQLISTAAAGAPLAVSSSTLVPNLNADKVDGLDASAFSQLGSSIDGSEISNGTITNVDVSSSAAIAGTKIDPQFGAQDVGTTGALSVQRPGISVAAIYAEATDQGGVGTNFAVRAVNWSPDGAAVSAYSGYSSGLGYGVVGESASTSGRGVYGTSSAPSGAAIGVEGRAASSLGKGVAGVATATTGATSGVDGLSSSTSGRGVYGGATATSGTNYGVLGETASTSGRGVRGNASATTGSTYGVEGLSSSTSGRGVRGSATATTGTTYGVEGLSSSTSGEGVYGTATASTGTTFGVHGRTSSSTSGAAGVFGEATTSAAYGVYGRNPSSSGRAIFGESTATSGTSTGVYGVSSAPSGTGVFGGATDFGGQNIGVYGQSNGAFGRGVFGWSVSLTGTTYGVYGASSSSSGRGVYGFATNPSGTTYGVYGETSSPQGYGVRGRVTSTTGVNFGVYGSTASTLGAGVEGDAVATSGSNYGVFGYSGSSSGYGVFSLGDFGGTGAKYFVQPHPTDAAKEVRFACLEGNESGTYFRGTLLVTGGRAAIAVPEDFRLVTNAQGLTVQLTALGPARVWVQSKSLQEIVVRADLDCEVDYLVQGVRLGFESLETIRDSVAFVPKYRNEPYGTQYPEALRRLLVANGTLNDDYTPNEVTAGRLGWVLRERESELPEGER